MAHQLEHQEISSHQHNQHIKILVDNLQSPANYGMMIRAAEALGVKEIIFYSERFDTLTAKMKRSSRSAEKYIQVRFVKDFEAEIEQAKADEFEIISLEHTSDSQQIRMCNFNQKSKLLICGNEAIGVSDSLLEMSDYAVHLPMYGENSSMNVVMATSIALWEIIGADDVQ